MARVFNHNLKIPPPPQKKKKEKKSWKEPYGMRIFQF